MDDPQGGNGDDSPAARRALSLFLLGFLTLFLELVLIRYLAGNIWNLGFFYRPTMTFFAVVALLFFSRYRFNRERHQSILAELAARKGPVFS